MGKVLIFVVVMLASVLIISAADYSRRNQEQNRGDANNNNNNNRLKNRDSRRQPTTQDPATVDVYDPEDLAMANKIQECRVLLEGNGFFALGEDNGKQGEDNRGYNNEKEEVETLENPDESRRNMRKH